MKSSLLWGSALGALSVILGAFGAHALSDHFNQDQLNWWNTAQYYQVIHTFALLATGILGYHFNDAWLKRASLLFLLGTAFFSGSLYVMALTEARWLGAVTPLGGMLMIGGWISLFLAIRKTTQSKLEG
ncbi:MAG: DUF423 domain-containing protein [Saprospiraceae bacterium]|nr:DUF423 domain-containing protein [Saprospiraceae bacterium]